MTTSGANPITVEASKLQTKGDAIASASAMSQSKPASASTVSTNVNTKKSLMESIKETTQFVLSIPALIENATSVIEDMMASADDVVNELATALEDPLAYDSDVDSMGNSMATSKTNPQKECGEFRLLSNMMNEVQNIASAKFSLSAPITKATFTMDHLMTYSYSGVLSSLTDGKTLVQDILNICASIQSALKDRSPYIEDYKSLDVIEQVSSSVSSAKSLTRTVSDDFKKSATFNKTNWAYALQSLMTARDILEASRGDLEGSAGSANLPLFKLTDQINLLRTKLCLLERSHGAVNDAVNAMKQYSNANIEFSIASNTPSVVDRINCHLDNILRVLTEMKKSGVLTINKKALEVYLQLQGIISFMTNTTNILKGLSDYSRQLPIDFPDFDSLSDMYDTELTFKKLINDFITEALILMSSNKSDKRLSALYTAIQNSTSFMDQYDTSFGSLINTEDAKTKEIMNEAVLIVDSIVSAISDSGFIDKMMAGDYQGAFSAFGYDLLAQRFIWAAKILTKINPDFRANMEKMAAKRKQDKTADNVVNVFLSRSYSLASSVDKQQSKQELVTQYAWYTEILKQITELKNQTQNVADSIRDYRLYAAKIVTEMTTPHTKICGKFM